MTDTPTQTSEREDLRSEREDWREADRRRVRRTRRTLIVALIVLIILLLITSYSALRIFQPVGKVASTEEAKGITWIRSIYGWGKAADQQFWGPGGVAIGPDGTIWATTQAQNRVVGFNPDGSFNAMLYQGPQGDARYPNALAYPDAVAVDNAGQIYIADSVRSTVWVMTRDNRIVRSIYVPTPYSVAVSDDRLVVGSASGFVILTPEGQVIKVLGKQGKGIDEFSAVRGVAIAKDGTIFAVDQYNNRVSAYDHGGTRKWIIFTGSPGNTKSVASSIVATTSSAAANMQIPAGMTIDAANRLVIADPFGFDFTLLDPRNGRLIAKYGAAGTIDGQFVYPSDISYDPARDWFAVADTQNARLQIVRLPDSGGSNTSEVNRELAGPLRACIFPLALLILAILAGIIYRVMNRKKKKKRDEEAEPGAQEVLPSS